MRRALVLLAALVGLAAVASSCAGQPMKISSSGAPAAPPPTPKPF